MATFDQRAAALYETVTRRNNEECIMEEIKNNSEKILANYDSLIQFFENSLQQLHAEFDLNSLGSEKDAVSLRRLLQLKDKIVRRRKVVADRIRDHESYRISERNRLNASSYTSFMSAFQKPHKMEHKPPAEKPMPPPAMPNVQQPKQISKNSDQHRSRKSLDLPRPSPRRSESRSQSPHIRIERPRSIELTVSQAATLAWDQKNHSTAASTATHHQRSSSAPRYHTVPHTRRKYDYVQPKVNTQINLTPLQPKIKSPVTPVSRSISGGNTTNINSNSNSNSRTKITVKEDVKTTETTTPPNSSSTKTYSDPRINEIMENLQGVDEQSCQQILNDILVTGEKLTWDDLAGLNNAKKSLKETVVYPFLRPDLFKGLREPISGMLLFGPPGTGKTMIAKTVANESNSTFFSVSASSLLSKYLGESEKLIRALFYLAKKLSPSIIFFDEIDSLLSSRNDNENESSRRVKTEFLIQWSNLSSATSKDSNDLSRVLVLAATNLPWAIDDAARRRFTRRLYIPLPEFETRLIQLKNLLLNSNNQLTETDFVIIANLTEGYSNSDITSLAKEAAMEPIRDLGDNLMNVKPQNIRGVELRDFENAMKTIKSSVSKETLLQFESWAEKFGSAGA